MELFSPGHLVVLAIVVAILFFGWKQLPDMSRSLGRSLRIFKTEIKGMSQDDKDRAEADEPKALEAPPAQVVRPQVVKKDVPTSAPQATSRPRPAPRPNAATGADNRSTSGQ